MPAKVAKIPRLVQLTAEREAAITSLLKKIETYYTVLPPNIEAAFALDFGECDLPTPRSHRRLFAYSFLNARSWDVEKAFEMVKSVCKFRQDRSLDTRVLLPTPFSVRGMDVEEVITLMDLGRREKGRIDEIYGAVNPYCKLGLHYRDKLGQPVLYALIGRVDGDKLLASLAEVAHIGETLVDVLLLYALHAFSVEDIMKEYSNQLQETGALKKEGCDASDGLVRAMTVVVDMEGFSLSALSKAVIDLFTGTMKLIFTYYPDCVHRILLVNCPSTIMAAFNLVKFAFDENTADKIGFYNPEDSKAALQQVIPKKSIPSFLGGECCCEGNCISNFDPKNPTKILGRGGRPSVKTENVHISAGDLHIKDYVVKKGERVAYEYKMSSDSVVFLLYFVPSAKVPPSEWKKLTPESAAPYLRQKSKKLKTTSSYTAPEDGTLVLAWDNRESWVMGDDLQIRVTKEAARN